MKRIALAAALALVACAVLGCPSGSENIGLAGSDGSAGHHGTGGTGGAAGSGGTGGSAGTGGEAGTGGSGGSAGSGGSGGTGGSTGCDAPVTITLPATGTYSLPKGGIVCLSVDLPAEQAIEIKLTSAVNLKGTISLRLPGGDFVTMKGYGQGVGSGRVLLALPDAGTYVVAIDNPDGFDGQVDASVKTLPADVLAVPDTRTLQVSGDPTPFVVKPEPGTTFAVSVSQDSTSGGLGVTFHPAGATMSTTGKQIRALAHRTSALLLPVIEVGTTHTAQATVTTFVPQPLPLDTDVALATLNPPNEQVLSFQGTAGTFFSYGEAGTFQNVTIYDPTGKQVGNPAAQVTPHTWALAMDGPYTVESSNPTTAAGKPFTLRFNTVPPPTTITPTARVDLAGTLALGEVHRYAFDVTEAEILRLMLSTQTQVDVEAVVTGGAAYNSYVKAESGQAPRQAQSLALFVQKTEPALLSVYSVSTQTDHSTGSYVVSLEAPVPGPTILGAIVAPTLDAGAMETFTLPNVEGGWHVLSWSYSGAPAPGSLQQVVTDVWGPTAPIANYDRGEINDLFTFHVNTAEEVGKLRAGTNTVSVYNRASDTRTATALVAKLDAPVAITPGAAASAGILEPGKRDYFSFDGTEGQAFTVTITAQFRGSLRVMRQGSADSFPMRDFVLPGFPRDLTLGVERTASFTLPAGGSGTYLIDIDADADTTGSYTVALSSP